MLSTCIRINVIKNISTQIKGAYNVTSGIQSTTFPVGTTMNGVTLVEPMTIQSSSFANFPNTPSFLSNNFNFSNCMTGSIGNFEAEYATGGDAAFEINFANNIEIEHSYKDMTKKCKITLPRNINNVKGLNLLLNNGLTIMQNNIQVGQVPLFGRGDRIIINLGYNQNFTEVFRGYITKVGIGTPIQIECEDSMYLLKNMQFQFNSLTSPANGALYTFVKNGKITLQNLIKTMLNGSYNNLLLPGQNIFFFPDNPNQIYPTETGIAGSNSQFGINRTDGFIPVYFDLNIDSDPFPFNTGVGNVLSCTEVLQRLKKDNPFLVFYFDDFMNFRIGSQFTNSGSTFITDEPLYFWFDSEHGNIIDEKNMKYQRADEINVQIKMYSERTNKAKTKLWATSNPNLTGQTYYGNPGGDIINVKTDNDLDQNTLNSRAAQLYNSQVYEGWTRDSSFTTFGLPLVHIGNKINLTSFLYPEKNGIYLCTGIKRIMGMGGYRQVINVGAKISS